MSDSPYSQNQARPPRRTTCDNACRRTKPFILYHWSPRNRRDGIKRRGLKIGSRHAVHSPGWKATYLCFSDSPSWAWAHSGQTSHEPGEWDLWMVWSHDLPARAKRSDSQPGMPTEYRCFGDVAKGKMWYLATRAHKPRHRR